MFFLNKVCRLTIYGLLVKVFNLHLYTTKSFAGMVYFTIIARSGFSSRLFTLIAADKIQCDVVGSWRENMRELEHLQNGPLAVFRISQNLSMRNLGITEHRKHGCNVTFLELGLKYRASVGDFALRISSTPFWCFFKEFRMFLICWNILYNDMVSPKPSLKGYEVLMYCGFVCYVLHF